jgi:hypothetical protein
MLLVLPFTTSAVPDLSRLYVVDEMVMAWPGFSVAEELSTYSVVPFCFVAAYVLPSMVSAGAGVMRAGDARDVVTPLMTMRGFDAEAGRE